MKEKLPFFANPSFLKFISITLWLPHIFSLAAIYRNLHIAFFIVAVILYVLAEKYIGLLLDIAGLIVSIVFGFITYLPLTLFILQIVSIIYPFIVNALFLKSIAKMAADENAYIDKDDK
jgi:hypothetical protein